jgi:hypothetical protein
MSQGINSVASSNNGYNEFEMQLNSFSNKNMISLKTIHSQTQIWSVWKQFILKHKYDQSENNSFSNTNMISNSI